MDINPQEVIKHLSNEIARLNIDNAIMRAALEQAQEKLNGIEAQAGENPN